jgi:hypothetical protein
VLRTAAKYSIADRNSGSSAGLVALRAGRLTRCASRWAGRSAALPRGIRPVSFTGAICPVPHETEAVVSKGVAT